MSPHDLNPACVQDGQSPIETAQDIMRSPVSISVIVTIHNGAHLIGRTLDSIFDQDIAPAEVVVVDDGSTDSSSAVVSEYARFRPVRLLQKPHQGVSSARNFGIRHSSGSLIALVSQDDICYADHLRALSEPFAGPHGRMLQHSAGWLRHRPDQRGGVMGLFRHGPARPGHLLRHVLMGMARTSRAMTPKARRRSVSINLRSALGWTYGDLDEVNERNQLRASSVLSG